MTRDEQIAALYEWAPQRRSTGLDTAIIDNPQSFMDKLVEIGVLELLAPQTVCWSGAKGSWYRGRAYCVVEPPKPKPTLCKHCGEKIKWESDHHGAGWVHGIGGTGSAYCRQSLATPEETT